MSSPPDLRALLTWCEDEGVRIDPRVCLAHSPTAGIHILATAPIAPDETLVWIPKRAVLSAQNCSIAEILSPLRAPYGHDAVLVLALALLYEQLLGDQSRWAGYLQSLPSTPALLALFWGHDLGLERDRFLSAQTTLNTGAPFTWSRRADGESSSRSDTEDSVGELDGSRLRAAESAETILEVRGWVAGTEIARELRLSRRGGGDGGGAQGRTLLEETRHFWRETGHPLFDGPAIHAKVHSTAKAVCEADFLRAYALVSSRSFIVDAYHRLAMVPIADAFNHTNENHVQLESDYDVCAVCGSLKECAHDDEDTGFNTRAQLRNGGDDENSTTLHAITETDMMTTGDMAGAEEDYCEMVAVAPVQAGKEVYNTYGALGNAQLLARYGFALDANEHDALHWDYPELQRTLARDRRASQDDAGLGQGSVHAGGAASLDGGADAYEDAAVARILHEWPTFDGWDDSMLVLNSTLQEGDSRRLAYLLNADGRISHALWVWVAIAMWPVESAEVNISATLLEKLAARQLEAENAMDDDSVESDGPCSDERDEVNQPMRGPKTHITEIDEADKLTTWLHELCSAMLVLLTSRRASIARGRSTAQLAEILDVTSDDPTIPIPTRLAMTHALSELSVLDSAEASWLALLSKVGR